MKRISIPTSFGPGRSRTSDDSNRLDDNEIGRDEASDDDFVEEDSSEDDFEPVK